MQLRSMLLAKSLRIGAGGGFGGIGRAHQLAQFLGGGRRDPFMGHRRRSGVKA